MDTRTAIETRTDARRIAARHQAWLLRLDSPRRYLGAAGGAGAATGLAAYAATGDTYHLTTFALGGASVALLVWPLLGLLTDFAPGSRCLQAPEERPPSGVC